jgi:hypothetical protein
VGKKRRNDGKKKETLNKNRQILHLMEALVNSGFLSNNASIVKGSEYG